MENQFQTVSSPARNVKTLIFTWIILAVMALWGLTVSVMTFIYFEAIILIFWIIMLFVISKVKWTLAFEGTTLTITNMANRRQFYFDDLKRSDFVFTQNKSQKSKNCAHLKIIGSSAVFNDVQNIEEMKAYIDRNFSE
ncbi:MAG: hypothetical protein E7641_04770 [Ruminococcaceae bacterium]|nr:hypothetical protein [Oscillospiraceae bacterium]